MTPAHAAFLLDALERAPADVDRAAVLIGANSDFERLTSRPEALSDGQARTLLAVRAMGSATAGRLAKILHRSHGNVARDLGALRRLGYAFEAEIAGKGRGGRSAVWMST